jgi:hypothetical protein
MMMPVLRNTSTGVCLVVRQQCTIRPSIAFLCSVPTTPMMSSSTTPSALPWRQRFSAARHRRSPESSPASPPLGIGSSPASGASSSALLAVAATKRSASATPPMRIDFGGPLDCQFEIRSPTHVVIGTAASSVTPPVASSASATLASSAARQRRRLGLPTPTAVAGTPAPAADATATPERSAVLRDVDVASAPHPRRVDELTDEQWEARRALINDRLFDLGPGAAIFRQLLLADDVKARAAASKVTRAQRRRETILLGRVPAPAEQPPLPAELADALPLEVALALEAHESLRALGLEDEPELGPRAQRRAMRDAKRRLPEAMRNALHEAARARHELAKQKQHESEQPGAPCRSSDNDGGGTAAEAAASSAPVGGARPLRAHFADDLVATSAWKPFDSQNDATADDKDQEQTPPAPPVEAHEPGACSPALEATFGFFESSSSSDDGAVVRASDEALLREIMGPRFQTASDATAAADDSDDGADDRGDGDGNRDRAAMQRAGSRRADAFSLAIEESSSDDSNDEVDGNESERAGDARQAGAGFRPRQLPDSYGKSVASLLAAVNLARPEVQRRGLARTMQQRACELNERRRQRRQRELKGAAVVAKGIVVVDAMSGASETSNPAGRSHPLRGRTPSALARELPLSQQVAADLTRLSEHAYAEQLRTSAAFFKNSLRSDAREREGETGGGHASAAAHHAPDRPQRFASRMEAVLAAVRARSGGGGGAGGDDDGHDKLFGRYAMRPHQQRGPVGVGATIRLAGRSYTYDESMRPK